MCLQSGTRFTVKCYNIKPKPSKARTKQNNKSRSLLKCYLITKYKFDKHGLQYKNKLNIKIYNLVFPPVCFEPRTTSYCCV